ncbi:hypothetical protein GCM10023189_02000 [Nibrella saemangeumensis]|uniref:Uncharacterized protein n=2 Tax=Nibrella saemangeumensis TaxID=1084526 RepID=A0ABP8M8X7_9BACT
MQYNAKEKTFEISVRIFTDDFETALTQENNGQKVKLTANDNNDLLIEKYIRKHFAIITPQKQRKPFQYLGHEPEGDANWVYLEMPHPEPFKGGTVQYDVLMELFNDQVNLLNLQYQGQKKTLMFRKNQPVQEIAL